eukprot:XP_011419724.1 PREDICTED: collagen alpha-1(IV) chain [Crassostrea gigas]
MPTNFEALPWQKGEKGNPGPEGEPGRNGLAGERGDDGIRGFTGDPGRNGDIGEPGVKGPPGNNGLSGIPGERGRQGLPGAKGFAGLPGLSGAVGEGYGIYFARHSQTTVVPQCPAGTAKLWDGFSLVHVIGNGRSHGQDLGTSGSCLRRFSTMPIMFCNINTVCNVAWRNDYSYWLSTREPMLPMMNPVEGPALQRYISRCSVCEAVSEVVAVHSQETRIPDCPSGFRSMWTGFSFMMSSGAGGRGAGQALESPGSCLEDFRATPFIECHGNGRCNHYATSYSFWLATLRAYEEFRTPISETLKAGSQEQRISRCRVCARQ